MIATDYDREGELIGLEALEEILDANPKLAREREPSRPGVKRARYSALTKEEIEEAFTNLVELSEPLARAGEARQDIDLIWGATLTRFVSLATGRLGSQFLSVGRVQSPTLAIVVERELERRAHVRQALLGGVRRVRASRRRVHRPPQGRQVLGGGRGEGRAREHDAARASSSRSSRSATRASRRRPSTRPPSRAPRRRSASRRRARCGSPRTSTWTGSSPTRAPTTPSTRSRCRCASCCSRSRRWTRSRRPRRSPSARELEPTRGKKETTDHPPIYPTQALDPKRAARRRPPQDLRAGRAPLPRDVRRPGGVGVDARRHRGRLGDLLRARQRAGRARLPRGLSVRALEGRGDPEGRGGPGAGARRGSRASAAEDAGRRTRGSTPRRPSRRRASARAS